MTRPNFIRVRSRRSSLGAPLWTLLILAVAAGAFGAHALLARTPPQFIGQQGNTAAPKPPAQPPPQTAGTPAPAQESQIPHLVANVGLVNVLASVQDKRGAFIAGLKQSNFHIDEDGRPQQIKFFSADTDAPITIGLLLDTSPSQTRVLEDEQQVSDSFFRQILTPKDLAFMINFDLDVTLVQDLTSSQALLQRAIDSVQIGGGSATSTSINPGPFPTSNQGGATHLWDAIYLACNEVLSQQVGRKALLVVTDGDDEGSSYNDQDALRAALDANTIVFAIIDADPSFYGMGGFGYSGASRLEHLAEESGGRGFPARHKDLAQTFAMVNDQLRTQYSLAYTSDHPDLDGTYRTIKVSLVGPGMQDYRVRARSGYFANRPKDEAGGQP